MARMHINLYKKLKRKQIALSYNKTNIFKTIYYQFTVGFSTPVSSGVKSHTHTICGFRVANYLRNSGSVKNYYCTYCFPDLTDFTFVFKIDKVPLYLINIWLGSLPVLVESKVYLFCRYCMSKS